MRKILVAVVIFGLLTLLLHNSYANAQVMENGVIITKKWEISFHGEPTTALAILYTDDGFKGVLGTTLGAILLDGEGVEQVVHIGSILVDPIVIGDRIYIAGSDKLYVISPDGSVNSMSISNIKLLASWGIHLVMCIPENRTTRIIVYDPVSEATIEEFTVDFTVDYVSSGDIDNDGNEELVLCSRFGELEIHNSTYGDLTYNLALDFEERINTKPQIGDIDGDGVEEIVVLTYHELSNASSKLLMIDVVESDGNTSEVDSVSLGQRAQALAIYDFNNDNIGDVFIGYEDGYYAFNIFTGETIFNVSTKGYIEGFERSPHIGDLDFDGEIEILYIGGKESIVMANSTGIEQTLYIPNEPIYTFAFIETKAEIMSISRYGGVILLDTSRWQILSKYNLLTGPLWGISPAVFDSGAVTLPLLDGRILIATESGDLKYVNTSGMVSDICYGDVDGDGVDEAVFIEYRLGISKINIIDGNATLHWMTVNGTVYGMSLCDLDFDGKDEVILNTGTRVIVNGSVQWDWIGDVFLSSIPPIVFDVDNDLKLEIVVASQDGAVYVLSSAGSIERRFDVTININNPIIVGDVNMDRGADYLVYQSGSLYRFDSSGRMLFMMKVGITENLYPVITDVDSDGFLEVIVGSDNNILVFSYRGDLLKCLNLSLIHI